MKTLTERMIEVAFEAKEKAWKKHCSFKSNYGREHGTLRGAYNRLARLERYLRQRAAGE
jgi:hypothetical protein